MVLIIPQLFRFLVKPQAIAIALWPFIIVKNPALRFDPRIINHERIHLRQQLELGVLFFYVLYVGEFLYHLIKTKDRVKAYYAISFEQEAYEKENDYAYLLQRKLWSFRKYYKTDLFKVKK